jgi:hypothetical protein
MDLFEALESGLIRYGRGYVFSRDKTPGSFYAIDEADEIPRLLVNCAETYAGSVFVSLDEPLPMSVPLDNPEHTWASAVMCGDWMSHVSGNSPPMLIGAIIAWSTDEIENDYRLSRQKAFQSLDRFHVWRHGFAGDS